MDIPLFLLQKFSAFSDQELSLSFRISQIIMCGSCVDLTNSFSEEERQNVYPRLDLPECLQKVVDLCRCRCFWRHRGMQGFPLHFLSLKVFFSQVLTLACFSFSVWTWIWRVCRLLVGNQKQGKAVEGELWIGTFFPSDCETCLLQDIRHNYENKEEEEEWNRLSGLFLVASCPVVKCRKFQTSPQSVALSIITMNTCRELLEVYALRERSRRGSRGSDWRLHHAQFVLP